MQRETALDELEEMALDAAQRLKKALEAGEVPISATYLSAIEKAHRMITSGLKANPLDEGDLTDEELLLKLVETTERLKRKIQRKQELDREANLSRLERLGGPDLRVVESSSPPKSELDS